MDDADVETALRQCAVWSHEQSHPETLKAAATHTDSMFRMGRNGSTTKDQVECMAQIANVHPSIEADAA